MKLLRTLTMLTALFAPVAAIASPPLTAACCQGGSCCPSCPLCGNAR